MHVGLYAKAKAAILNLDTDIAIWLKAEWDGEVASHYLPNDANHLLENDIKMLMEKAKSVEDPHLRAKYLVTAGMLHLHPAQISSFRRMKSRVKGAVKTLSRALEALKTPDVMSQPVLYASVCVLLGVARLLSVPTTPHAVTVTLDKISRNWLDGLCAFRDLGMNVDAGKMQLLVGAAEALLNAWQGVVVLELPIALADIVSVLRDYSFFFHPQCVAMQTLKQAIKLMGIPQPAQVQLWLCEVRQMDGKHLDALSRKAAAKASKRRRAAAAVATPTSWAELKNFQKLMHQMYFPRIHIGHTYWTPPPRMCHFCGKFGCTLRMCGRCKRAEYCSEACQRNDWKIHKVLCRRM